MAITDNKFDGKALRKAREAAGYTVRGIAKKVGVSPQAVSSWELGVTAPKPEYREKLDAILGSVLTAMDTRLSVHSTGVKAIRENRGLSPVEVSQRAGVSAETIRAFERGSSTISSAHLDTVLAIAGALGVQDVRDLIPVGEKAFPTVIKPDSGTAGFAERCDAVGLTNAVLARECKVSAPAASAWRTDPTATVPSNAWSLLMFYETLQAEAVEEALTDGSNFMLKYPNKPGVAVLVYFRDESDVEAVGVTDDLSVARARQRAVGQALAWNGWNVRWSFPKHGWSRDLWHFEMVAD